MYELLQDFGIGKVLTNHPPAYHFKDGTGWSLDQALEVGRQFYRRIDDWACGKEVKIGLENVLPTGIVGTYRLGYEPWHIGFLLDGTRNLGIVLDSGHAKLAGMDKYEHLQNGKLVNAHFHYNNGEFKGSDSDEHMIATPERMDDYWEYIEIFRQNQNPIVLELKDKMELGAETISRYISRLREDLAD
jgi:sugar phosphate isomerase/epimerase